MEYQKDMFPLGQYETSNTKHYVSSLLPSTISVVCKVSANVHKVLYGMYATIIEDYTRRIQGMGGNLYTIIEQFSNSYTKFI